MCGRYRLTSTDRALEKYFSDSEIDLEIEPHYNICPTQQVVTLTSSPNDGKIVASRKRWGLIPSWSKDTSIGYKLINGRSETVFMLRAFSEAIKKRRCLIPADGFYEWKSAGKIRRPYHFGMSDDRAFAFAGLWESWRSPEGGTVKSCTILTTTSNELLDDMHDRMPVILHPKNYKRWLTTEVLRAEQLQDLLVPYEASEMKRYRVSQLVNSPKNDTPECIVEMPLAKSATLF